MSQTAQLSTNGRNLFCKTDAFFVVLHLGDEESVKHVLIVVFREEAAEENPCILPPL